MPPIMSPISARFILSLILSVMASTQAVTAATLKRTFEISEFSVLDDTLKIRVGQKRPEGSVRGDVLYFHGYGDRFDNHGPLFEEWSKVGFRVISFDFPQHGGTHGMVNDLDKYTFKELAALSVQVEKATRESYRPLILSGWGVGGLLAIRMLQPSSFESLDRTPIGAILYAPAVAVQKLVGTYGAITKDSLTSNPFAPFAGLIYPMTPAMTPLFTANIGVNLGLAQMQTLPMNIPILTFVAGIEVDHYVDSQGLKNWVFKQRSKGAQISGAFCKTSFHALDMEPMPVGDEVRSISANFATAAITRNFNRSEIYGKEKACSPF